MASIIHHTEDLGDAYWTPADLTVTVNNDVGPFLGGSYSGLADKLDDASATQPGSLFGTYETIPNDSGPILASWFVKKPSTPTTNKAFFAFQTAGGSGLGCTISFDPWTGSLANGDGGSNPADAKGVIDNDPNYWRIWWRRANDSSGNTLVRLFMYPAYSAALGGSIDGSQTGAVTLWGANVTLTSAIQQYVPDPFYQPYDATLSGTVTASTSKTDIIAGGKTIIITLGTGVGQWIPS